MLNVIRDWIIHLFTPHCFECERGCSNCENYLMIIEKQRNDYQLLLSKVINSKNETTQVPQEVNFQNISTTKPWHVRRRELEQQDRIQAEKIRMEAVMAVEGKKSTEQLEKELLGDTNGNV